MTSEQIRLLREYIDTKIAMARVHPTDHAQRATYNIHGNKVWEELEQTAEDL